MKNLSAYRGLLRPLTTRLVPALAGLALLATAAPAQAQTPTFAPVVLYSTGPGSSPFSIAVADVNGDGKPDLLTANYNASTAGVLLGNGNGTFQAAAPYSTGPAGSYPFSIAVADVNGDGKPDLLTANSSTNSAGVLLNTTFAAPTLTSLSPTSGPVGTSVTLIGTTLTGATSVSFNGTIQTTITNNNATSLTVQVPTGASTGNVTVTTPGGTSNGVSFIVTASAAVTTAVPTFIASTSATLGGTVSSDGGSAITERGVVYVAGTGTPTTANTKRTAPGTTGSYTVSATGLTAATQYTVRAYATNAVGTSYGGSQTFTTAAPLAASTSRTNVSCFGGTNGTATATATDGVAPYTYSWNTTPVQTAATATGLSAGTYTVTVTDAAGQTATAQAVVGQPTALASSISSQTNVGCFGGTNGAATVSVSGGTPTYSYSWAPSGGSAATATGLTAGTYTVTITDANGCTKTQDVIITQPATALAVSTTKTDATTIGGNNGTATATATGGTPAYSYSWNTSPVQTTATATGLSAGTYTVTVTDAKGCTTSASATVGQPAVVIPVVTTATPASITSSGATLGGNVTADGGATVTERGVVYVLGTGTPTTANIKVVIGSGMGSFSQAVTGLTAATQYTVQAYATNAVGTSYGGSQTFITAIATATASPALADKVSVFPNPARGQFTVQVPGVAGAAQVRLALFNTLGQLVREQVAVLPAAGTRLSVNTQGLATGVYVLHLTAGNASLSKRLALD